MGVRQLLQLLLQAAQRVGVLQGLGTLVDDGGGAAGADPLPLAAGGVDQLAAAGEGLLLPHHVAGYGHRVVADVVVGHGGLVRVHEIGRQTQAEVDQGRQQNGGEQQPRGKGAGFHWYAPLRVIRPPPTRSGPRFSGD